MSVLFVSHSSKDDATAVALEAWLRAEGFTDIFVDHQNIAGGDSWRRALQTAAGTCRVVLCLVSENWLESSQCMAEYDACFYMGKRVIPLFLTDSTASLSVEARRRLEQVLAHYQGLNLSSCRRLDGVLHIEADRAVADRLRAALREAGALARIGLDPQAFTINRATRPMPFPGLASFGDDDADAALFYGRSREIAEALEELRKVRAERDLRPFVMLGASGAGKSSLLKAGVIPRLRREAPGWLPLRAFRPGADPLLNFAEAFARTLADFGKVEAHGFIRDRLFAAWSETERGGVGAPKSAARADLEAALEAEGRALRAAAGRAEATILVSVDQAEEIAQADGQSGDALAACLRTVLASTASRWQLVFAIRTDSFPALQAHRRFQDLKARGYDLRAIPAFRFDSVVEEPAKRYNVAVEDLLVDALMEEAPKDDALPLLAFALERLWRQYAASGALTKANYDNVGGLTGLIEDAAERALRGFEPEQDVALPAGPAPKRLVAVGAATFVPALAQVNEHGATTRRVAAWSTFDDEQQALLARFDRWRLVVRKGGPDGGTVEVAHEALLRNWQRLHAWFEPERARLDALRALEVDAAAWERNAADPGFLNHRGRRLAEADALVDNQLYRRRVGAREHNYLAACGAVESAARRRALRLQAFLYAMLVGIIIGLVGWIEQDLIWTAIHEALDVKPFRRTHFASFVLTDDAERALKPKELFRDCMSEVDCPEMIVVPAGRFQMGSPPDEPDRQPQEGPVHEVTIARRFAVSEYDVTFENWDVCVAHGDCDAHVSDTGFGRGRQPVINVTWDDAQRYVAWLSMMTGKKYRLLSEAEYEYAARAGTTTIYPWGDAMRPDVVNCHGCNGKRDKLRPEPVGRYKPNAFGLYDVIGNASVWVEDCGHESYDGAPDDGSAWITENCGTRVLRAANWGNDPQDARVAFRSMRTTDFRNGGLGLRVARTLEP